MCMAFLCRPWRRSDEGVCSRESDFGDGELERLVDIGELSEEARRDSSDR